MGMSLVSGRRASDPGLICLSGDVDLNFRERAGFNVDDVVRARHHKGDQYYIGGAHRQTVLLTGVIPHPSLSSYIICQCIHRLWIYKSSAFDW